MDDAELISYLLDSLTYGKAQKLYTSGYTVLDSESQDRPNQSELAPNANGITVIHMRFDFDPRKSEKLRANPHRGIGFEEAQDIFRRPYYQDQRSDLPEQYRAIGWVGQSLYSLIFEIREDNDGEFYHLVTLWKSTRQEEELYAENS